MRTMRTRIAVVAVAIAASVPSSVAAQDCGGDHPQWILVTQIGARFLVSDETEGVRTNDHDLGPSPVFIKVCDIDDVSILRRRERGDNPTAITLRSTETNENLLAGYLLVLETPEEICAAMANCRDATAQSRGRGQR